MDFDVKSKLINSWLERWYVINAFDKDVEHDAAEILQLLDDDNVDFEHH